MYTSVCILLPQLTRTTFGNRPMRRVCTGGPDRQTCTSMTGPGSGAGRSPPAGSVGWPMSQRHPGYAWLCLLVFTAVMWVHCRVLAWGAAAQGPPPEWGLWKDHYPAMYVQSIIRYRHEILPSIPQQGGLTKLSWSGFPCRSSLKAKTSRGSEGGQYDVDHITPRVPIGLYKYGC